MRLAVIDCGTNTFNLIVMELFDGKSYTKIFQTRIPVKLGEGAINEGYIAPAAFKRGLDALMVLNDHVKEHNVEKLVAYATSAIRDAANGMEFIEKAASDFNIKINVIDGDREAELIYFGVREAVSLTAEPSLIIDIGGGSTEFIIASNKDIFWKGSFRIGAARLLEKFNPSDPITNDEISRIHHYLSEQLASLKEAVKKYRPQELIGSSGAFDSLVEMIHGEMNGEPLHDTKTEYEIGFGNYEKITGQIKSSTLAQRRLIKGLVPMRVDMIVISCVMVDFIINTFHLEKLRVSTYSLKEGALVDYIHNNS